MNFVFSFVICFITMNCIKCPKSFNSFEKLLYHLRLTHSNENNFSINCNFDNCHKVFRNVSSFKSHAFRKHFNILQDVKSTHEKAMNCKNCNLNISQEELPSHLRKHCTDGDTITCPVNLCNQKFTVYSSYTSHFSRKHKHHSLKSTLETTSQLSIDTPLQNSPIEEGGALETIQEKESNLKRNVALLQLKIQEKYLIPQSTVQKIFDDYTEIFQLFHSNLISCLDDMSGNQDVDGNTLSKIKQELTENSIFKCFKDLNSICKRKLYYKQELNFVEPRSHILGLDKLNKKCVFHYVSILDTLKFLLKQDIVLSQVLNPTKTDENLFVDFKDGCLFKKHPLFSTNPSALQVFLYCDEFEVCNPLGVNRKVHKLLAFYYVLGNVHSKFRSTVDCIQLVLLCKNVYVRKFGLQEVLKPLIEDLKILNSEGIVVNNMVFQGDLAYISADNLASHFIGGFLESFSPNVNKLCRTCLCSREELITTFNDDRLLFRTRENYTLHAQIAKNDPKSITNYGIKFDSPFNLGNFHVVDGLPPDIAHDLLEGVVPYEVGLILQHLIVVEKLFSLDYVNSQIESFPYGTLDILDKPCVINSSFKVTQTASKMWCLIRLLPLMCHTKVQEQNLYWALLLDLKSIVEIVFAPQLNIDYVAYLKMKVFDHLKLFVQLFPNQNIKPKQHFLIHYAHHMMNFGPLKKCWTLRFEAKHFYFKRLASAGKNFKQLGFTLAQRHQMYQAYITESNNYLQPNVAFGSKKQIFSQSMESDVFTILQEHGFVENGSVNVFSFLSINSLKYSSGMYVMIGVENDEISVGCIEFILSKLGTTFFLISHSETFYNAHVGAYLVNKSKKWSVIKSNELLDAYPLTSYYSDSNYYIVPKYVVL